MDNGAYFSASLDNEKLILRDNLKNVAFFHTDSLEKNLEGGES